MNNYDFQHLDYLRREAQAELGYAVLTFGGTTMFTHSAREPQQEIPVQENQEESEGLDGLLN